MAKNRTEVADIDRSLYDFRYGEEGFERLDAGLTPDIVREISERKDEPAWMLEQDTAAKMGIVYSGIEEALHEPKWEAIIRE